jgi:predicted DNA binding CopG/RHH family protein
MKGKNIMINKKKKLKPIPRFKNEDEEREFWSKNDSTEYIDWSTAQRVVFPNLKYSTKSISIRMPSSILDRIKAMANERDVPYQSLIKMILADRVEEEIKKYRASKK